MTFFKALCISFSIYSKIPMPHFEWKDRDMRYHMIFFPWIGIVIALLLMLWVNIAKAFMIGDIAFVLIGTAIPILVTGGFHIDGFMDMMDACKSYKPKEEKLKILEDPHIGAFAVIMLAAAGLIYIAALSQLNEEAFLIFALGFILARALSGIAVFVFPKAKKNGMLHDEYSSAEKAFTRGIVLKALLVEAAICILIMILIDPVCGLFVSASGLAAFVYYRQKSLKEFGGITGDTAGYFVVVSEIAMCAAAAFYSVVF